MPPKLKKRTILIFTADRIGGRHARDHYPSDRLTRPHIPKAKVLDDARMAKITDAYTAMSLRLQSAFGLRREESIKIVPAWADGGDRLKIKDSGPRVASIARSLPARRNNTPCSMRLSGLPLTGVSFRLTCATAISFSAFEHSATRREFTARMDCAITTRRNATASSPAGKVWREEVHGHPIWSRSKSNVISRRACYCQKKCATRESKSLRCNSATSVGNLAFCIY